MKATRWSSLKILNLAGNYLEILSEKFDKLINLEELIIFYNKLRILPKTLSACKNLKILDCHKNNISSVPLEISQLKNILIFDLAKNNIEEADACGNLGYTSFKQIFGERVFFSKLKRRKNM